MIYVHYSSDTKQFAGFYDTEIHNVIPKPNLPLTKEQHLACYAALLNGTGFEVQGTFIKPFPKPVEIAKTWEDIRKERNKLLDRSDYTQMPDWPGDKAAWSNYRQALRDIPQSFNNPSEVVWPSKPENK